jgi:hypothetical protein
MPNLFATHREGLPEQGTRKNTKLNASLLHSTKAAISFLTQQQELFNSVWQTMQVRRSLQIMRVGYRTEI